MTRPQLLDLFCGAGGAAMGYHRAGFDVVGVDIEPQPRYPFEFIQGDALDVGATLLASGRFDAVHASPPCQAYSRLRFLPWLRDIEYWDSIPPVMAMLASTPLPWIVENVEGAPLDGLTLCGQMFGLHFPDGKPLYRHRLFASSLFMLAPAHPKHHVTLAMRTLNPSGTTRLNSGYVIGGPQKVDGGAAMGIDWMTKAAITQAIPPAYTEWLGAQLLASIGAPTT